MVLNLIVPDNPYSFRFNGIKLKDEFHKMGLEEYDIGYYLDLEKSQWTDDLEEIFRDQKEYDRKVSNIAKHYREFLWETHESEYLDFIKRISKGE